MFENVLGQSASLQLIEDIKAGYLAQAMLFQGPPASGKGTAALELGRVISCESGGGAQKISGPAAWACQCHACSRHRLLLHPDLLCLGPRSFSAEITASSKTFLREAASQGNPVSIESKAGPGCMLFLRSVRKLLLRFNPVLWEDEPKGSKIFPLVNSLEDSLDELGSPEADAVREQGALFKLVEGILKDSYKLESEGMAELIPIGQLRRAASWSHLAPAGRGKILILENADRMQEEARNSLLKILEEPPPSLYCVLTSFRPGSMLPTILSRLRPYRFNSRDAEVEREVIRRVFRTEIGPEEPSPAEPGSTKPSSSEANSMELASASISLYLDSFLPVSGAVLEGLAAFFTASVAYKAVLISKKQGRPLPQAAVMLGKYSAPKAEEAGLGRPTGEPGALVAAISEKANNFEIRSLFSRFLSKVLEQVSGSQRYCAAEGSSGPSFFLPGPGYNEMWKKCVNWAGLAVLTYKLRPAQVLEKMFADLGQYCSNASGRGMADL